MTPVFFSKNKSPVSRSRLIEHSRLPRNSFFPEANDNIVSRDALVNPKTTKIEFFFESISGRDLGLCYRLSKKYLLTIFVAERYPYSRAAPQVRAQPPKPPCLSMIHPVDSVPSGIRHRIFSPAIVVAIALAAIGTSYLVAIADLEVGTKTRAFSVIIAVFLVTTVCLHLLQSRRARIVQEHPDVSPSFEDSLAGLDEAKDLFAGSLSPADSFRLAVSRIRGLIPCKTVLLFVYDAGADHLTVKQAEGSRAAEHLGLSISPRDGQPGDCYCSKQVQVGPQTVAIPLETGTAPFGVLQLFFDHDFDPATVDRPTFEGIGSRIAPLVMSSVAFEQTHATALTDATTDLPNERAFHMVLENQMAESQRKPDERPLTILALDIRGFDDINQRFGHAAGDRLLAFVAGVVKENLRQMDFFARAGADEFLVVLPTATKEVSHEIIARIHTGFFGRKLKITDADAIEVEINVGWAAFGTDGETPETLLRAARERKAQSKSPNPPKVLWFPSELAN